MKAKLNYGKTKPFEWNGFVVQKGFVYGYIDDLCIVTNGTILKTQMGTEYIYVYVYSDGQWLKKRTFDSGFLKAIAKTKNKMAKKAINGAEYATPLTLEESRGYSSRRVSKPYGVKSRHTLIR